MAGGCVVPGCKNVGCHALPKGSARRSLWMAAMRLEEQSLKMKYPSICSLHFKETDYMDFDIEPLNMKRRHLKRHAVPSIFPWNLPPPKDYIHIHLEELNSKSDSEIEKENFDSRDPLAGFTEDDKQSPDNHSVSSDTKDCETALCFNAKKAAKTYSNKSKPVKLKRELPYNVTAAAAKAPIRDSRRVYRIAGKPIKVKRESPYHATATTTTGLAGKPIKVEWDSPCDVTAKAAAEPPTGSLRVRRLAGKPIKLNQVLPRQLTGTSTSKPVPDLLHLGRLARKLIKLKQELPNVTATADKAPIPDSRRVRRLAGKPITVKQELPHDVTTTATKEPVPDSRRGRRVGGKPITVKRELPYNVTATKEPTPNSRRVRRLAGKPITVKREPPYQVAATAMKAPIPDSRRDRSKRKKLDYEAAIAKDEPTEDLLFVQTSDDEQDAFDEEKCYLEIDLDIPYSIDVDF